MKHALFALAAAIASPASATIVLSDNFDAENGGATALNYTGFANWTVPPFLGPASAVDIVNGANNPYGISCSGICVDLDGSTGTGGLIATRNFYSFSAGDRVTLSVDISGNQRGGVESYILGALFAGAYDIFDLTITDPFGSFNFGPAAGPGGSILVGDQIPFDRPFGRYSLSFRALAGGAVSSGIGTDSMDNIGPLIDNVVLDITAVPEPASWAMMIAGFVLTGGAMRRRKPTAALA
jgi:hypothetical protein